MERFNSLTQSLKYTVTALRAKRTGFSDVVPPPSVLAIPLDDLALVILRSLKDVKPNNALDSTMTIRVWADSYPREQRAEVNRRLTEAWNYLQQKGLIAPTKVMGVWETWFVTKKGMQVVDAGHIAFGDEELLPKGLLYQPLAEAAEQLYYAGRYDDACAAAFKQLEILVRKLIDAPDDLVGANERSISGEYWPLDASRRADR